LTRSVRDSARLLDAIQGDDAGPPYSAPAPRRPFAEELERDPQRLKVAVSRTTPTGVPIDPECMAALESTVSLLGELGHDVVEAAPEIDGTNLSQSFLGLWMAGTTHELEAIGMMLGVRSPKKRSSR